MVDALQHPGQAQKGCGVLHDEDRWWVETQVRKGLSEDDQRPNDAAKEIAWYVPPTQPREVDAGHAPESEMVWDTGEGTRVEDVERKAARGIWLEREPVAITGAHELAKTQVRLWKRQMAVRKYGVWEGVIGGRGVGGE